jgi:hypothetical protein
LNQLPEYNLRSIIKFWFKILISWKNSSSYPELEWCKVTRTILPSVVQFSPEATIYVADNASTDDSVAFVVNFPTVQIVRNSANYGFARLQCISIKLMEIYALVNSDIEVTEIGYNPLLIL